MRRINYLLAIWRLLRSTEKRWGWKLSLHLFPDGSGYIADSLDRPNTRQSFSTLHQGWCRIKQIEESGKVPWDKTPTSEHEKAARAAGFTIQRFGPDKVEKIARGERDGKYPVNERGWRYACEDHGIKVETPAKGA